MNGISWQSSPCRRKNSMTDIYSWKMVWGMLRLLNTEVQEAVQAMERNDTVRHFSVATGKTGSTLYRKKIFRMFRKKFPNIQGTVYAIRNDFFGPMITVSGLITGTGSDRTAERSGTRGTASDPVQHASGGRKMCSWDDITVEEGRRSITDKNHCGK